MTNEGQYRDLGVTPYRDAWQQQETLMEQLISDRKAGKPGYHYLLMVEHPHVYTLGKHGNQNNMLADRLLLQAKGAELIRTDRGGDITYHGPGQLVVYPVFRLDTLEIGIKNYIYRLEEVIIRSIGEYGLKGCRLEKATGVWLDVQSPAVRKICAIGVRCSQSVTMHGFALNVNTDLNYFSYINPCGFADKGVTSLEKETGEKMDMKTVKELVLHHFETVFEIKFVPNVKIT
ncbi:MAG: lipoyl(octanoyl) transferase LipB [Bacteroidales bacterium]|jgi:lipoyl(octanoyl) transferase|nr:lipoyl(octanoyl) transferase LipB [Bacteroidales bacterium]